MKLKYILSVILMIVGCGDTQKSTKETSSNSSAQTMKKMNLKEVWQVRFVDETLLASYSSKSGWQKYYSREFEQAMSTLEGEALARIHVEYSALYRQALLLHSNATFHAYEGYKNKLDPPQVSYLLAVSSIFKNDIAKSESYLSKYTADPQTDSRVSQWKKWLASDKKAKPQLEGFFFSADNTSPQRPPAHEDAIYSFGSGDTSMSASEGTSLWLRALWHENEARKLLKDKSYGSSLVSLLINPWRLPFEKNFTSPTVEALSSVPDDWFFFGFYLNSADIGFLGSLSPSPKESLQKWQDTSVLAQYISRCIKQEKLDVECVVDQATTLESEILSLNKSATSDRKEEVNTALLYDLFPKFARYALYRAAALWAEENGQHEDSGRFRLMVREASGVIRDPLFLISLAAWCAGNEDTLRSADLLHEFSSEFSSLQSARIPLDSLHIRVGRQRIDHGPTH